MFFATDVHYDDARGTGRAALVVFEQWTSLESVHELVVQIGGIEPYQPGDFYRRELPCLARLLEELPLVPSVVIVDGYVDLALDRPGLGRHLYAHLGEASAVVGAAKTAFLGAETIAVTRGASSRPLWVTAAGIPLSEAAAGISSMHGAHRLPTLLKRADQLARGLVVPRHGNLEPCRRSR